MLLYAAVIKRQSLSWCRVLRRRSPVQTWPLPCRRLRCRPDERHECWRWRRWPSLDAG